MSYFPELVGLFFMYHTVSTALHVRASGTTVDYLR